MKATKQEPDKQLRSFEVHETGYAFSWHVGAPDARTISGSEGHEPALPDLEKSLMALVAVFMRFTELPKAYITNKKIRIVRIYIGYNKHDARSVKLDAVGTLKGGRPWSMRSNTLRIDDACDGEKNVQIEVEAADIDTILDFCDHAIDYAEDKRGQGTMIGEPDPDPENTGTGELV